MYPIKSTNKNIKQAHKILIRSYIPEEDLTSHINNT